MSCKRVRYVVAFTVPDADMQAIIETLGSKLSKIYGGVTFCRNCTGFWAENGDEFLETYSDVIHEESIIYMQLSVTLDFAEQALEDIQNAVKYISSTYKTQTQFVHVESQIVTAHHFNVQDI